MKDAIKSFYQKLKKFNTLFDEKFKEESLKELFHKNRLFSDENIKSLETKLHIKIGKLEYYEQAFVHRSYLQVEKTLRSNERLEFLGDSILGMAIAEHLFYRHKDLPEGELTKIRSWLVNRHTLAICARELGVLEFIKLSHSARSSIEGGVESILADALEAIIAAIYLDKGFDYAKRFIETTMLPIMIDRNLFVDENFKSILLEKAQGDGFSFPVYQVIEMEGPDHAKNFKVGVYIEEDLAGTGVGKSKKQAEQCAAKDALDNYLDFIYKNKAK